MGHMMLYTRMVLEEVGVSLLFACFVGAFKSILPILTGFDDLRIIDFSHCTFFTIKKPNTTTCHHRLSFTNFCSLPKKNGTMLAKRLLCLVVALLAVHFATTIRVQFNYDLLTSDARACTAAGAKVPIGTPASPIFNCRHPDVITDCHYTCLQTDVASESSRQAIITATTALATRLPSILTLKNAARYPLFSNGITCNAWDNTPTSMPSNATSSNADLVIVVTSRPIADTRLLAHSQECASDVSSARPVLAILNVIPNIFGQLPETRELYILHELVHILGFNSAKFAQFRDENGNVRSNVVISQQNSAGNSIKKLTTPNLIAKAKEHFGCTQALDGIELEDHYDPYKTKDNHFEKRIFFNELMTGEFTGSPGDGPVMSTMTLAVLQDSGWYNVNYSAAAVTPYVWGLRTGCTLLTQRCGTWNDERYFCQDRKDNQQCTFDLNSKGVCDVGDYTSAVPAVYKNFDKETKGGQNVMRDYCTVNLASGGADCRDPNNKVTERVSITGERYHPQSRCIIANSYSM